MSSSQSADRRGLRACTKEVRKALKALESSAVADARAAALQPAADNEDVPLADQEGGPNAAPSEVENECPVGLQVPSFSSSQARCRDAPPSSFLPRGLFFSL